MHGYPQNGQSDGRDVVPESYNYHVSVFSNGTGDYGENEETGSANVAFGLTGTAYLVETLADRECVCCFLCVFRHGLCFCAC